jgi:hypothetical protein
MVIEKRGAVDVVVFRDILVGAAGRWHIRDRLAIFYVKHKINYAVHKLEGLCIKWR